MSIYAQKRFLPYTPVQLFDLVAAFDRYRWVKLGNEECCISAEQRGIFSSRVSSGVLALVRCLHCAAGDENDRYVRARCSHRSESDDYGIAANRV
jgi:hypothetical protein